MALLDFTTFTQVDPLSKWAVASGDVNKIEVTGLTEGDSSYVYKDYTSDYFGNYEVDLDIRMTSFTSSGDYIGVFKVSNSLQAGTNSGEQAVCLESASGSTVRIRAYNGSSTDYYSGTVNTTYYLKIIRRSITFIVKIYSSSIDRTNDENILSTLSPSGFNNDNFRYLYCGFSEDSSGTSEANGYIENMEIVTEDEESLGLMLNFPAEDVYVDSNGNIHICGRHATTTSDLIYAVSTDGGQTFTDGEGGGAGSYKKWNVGNGSLKEHPRIVVDSQGNKYIVFRGYSGSSGLFYTKYSNDTAPAWGSMNVISTTLTPYNIRIEIDNDDNIVVIACGNYSGSSGTVIYSSVDRASNWVTEYDNNGTGSEFWNKIDMDIGLNQHMWISGCYDSISHDSRINKVTKTEGSPDSWAITAENITDFDTDTLYGTAIVAERDTETIWQFISIYDGSNYKIQYSKKVSGVWGTWTTLESNSTNRYVNLSAVRDYDSNIYLTYNYHDGSDDLNGIYIITYDGSTWTSETSLETIGYNAVLQNPSLTSGQSKLHYKYDDIEVTTSYYSSYFLNNAISSDGLTLSDDIHLKLILEIEEQLNFSDSFSINQKEIELQETLDLVEDIYTNITLEKTEPDITLSLIDEIIAGYVSILDIDNKFNMANQQLYDIENKINIAEEDIYDIDNKINTVKEEMEDITNKINTAILVQSDILSAFHSAKLKQYDIDNKINLLKPGIDDITNDFRMRASWQVGGDLGVQSKGKGELKIYIDGIEETDADIDSLKIIKQPGQAWVATFDLDRSYDDNKPTLEDTIEIKYYGIRIYYGYLTSIEPTDDPEKMGIVCQNKYWIDNRNKVWFNIGHTPADDRELYYNTIQDGLSAVGVSFGNIGNFIPQTMNLFGTGRSDAISHMVQNCGNFDWYYDDNENKRLWTANGGGIVDLAIQKLGNNLSLFDVLKHNISESADNIVNKYRVQMGDQVIRRPGRQGETREYRYRIIGTSRVRAVPLWDSSLEVLSKNSGNGYGFDYPGKGNAGSYADVYKKYKILNSYLGTNDEWSDWRPPVVELARPFGASAFSIPSASDGILTEGFSVDFEEGLLTLNEPLYYTEYNTSGEAIKNYSPTVTLILYKQTWVTRTETDSDSPEVDISNPLMFFTNKVGSYPTTILGTLNLSGLSIQGGSSSIVQSNSGDLVRTSSPSWDDTDFAEDLAYWRLSETADKKVSGEIVLTLDALIFYGIDLNKRIMMNGILDSPLNITSITYNMNDFTATLNVESFRYYRRTVNMQSHGQGITISSKVTL